ncbi:HNH endonuclease signature motif containing protein [Burkholderia ubonensis]|uniref:HNH endonuclease n=1 Tax=Burkholderia ubonensis TaxID=101571 RepID=UPI000ADF721A|nr:HNH endonuclease signature motif containing protein [Burkholderia ubonensis]
MDWDSIFDTYGTKTVTATDKKKKAYVPNKDQRAAIESSGIEPAKGRPAPEFDVLVLFDTTVKSVKSSYYYAGRSAAADRPPEPRMGHEIISSWLNEGDEVVIGSVGTQLFAIKTKATPKSAAIITDEVVARADKKIVLERAKEANGKPAKQKVERNDFARNPYVVRGAILRSAGKCEMPGCKCELFEKEDGSTYLEVHHVTPLSEDGDDTLANAAALCPRCHRELHFGKERLTLRKKLASHIAAIS